MSSGAESLRAGMLLVAAPTLADPNFAGSVVLLLDTDEDGALGVVVNRPTPVLVGDVLFAWGDVVGEPEVLFRGGPVGTDGALAVGRLADPSVELEGFRGVVGSLGVVDLDAPADAIRGSLADLRIFAGYAGWGAGQLEGEIEGGDWYLLPAEESDAFRADPSGLRGEVLRRQPGELAWHATRPADPAQN